MSRIDEIKQRLEAIPKDGLKPEALSDPNGEEWSEVRTDKGGSLAYLPGYIKARREYAKLFAHAPDDLRYLLTEVERLTKENAWLKSQLPF